jgi:hypothetical protein
MSIIIHTSAYTESITITNNTTILQTLSSMLQSTVILPAGLTNTSTKIQQVHLRTLPASGANIQVKVLYP